MLLNVEADHLDRHGTLEDYLAAKLQIFARQGNDDVAVAPFGLAVEDLGGCARRVPFGPGGELDDRAGHLWWDGEPLIAHDGDPPARRAQPRQRRRGGGDRARARDRSRRRPRGAAHVRRRRAPPRGGRDGRRRAVRQRLEGDERRLDARRARELRGRAACTSSSAARARARTSRRCAAARTRSTSSARTPSASAARPAAQPCGDLATAVARARAAARPGDVVLLSPACASFDQFADFEARGRAFRALVTSSGRRRRGAAWRRPRRCRACGGAPATPDRSRPAHPRLRGRSRRLRTARAPPSADRLSHRARATRNAADAEEAAQDAFVKAGARCRASTAARRFGRGCWRSSPTRRATAAARPGAARLLARARGGRAGGAAPPPAAGSPEAALLVAERDAALAAALERLESATARSSPAATCSSSARPRPPPRSAAAPGTVKSRLSRALGAAARAAGDRRRSMPDLHDALARWPPRRSWPATPELAAPRARRDRGAAAARGPRAVAPRPRSAGRCSPRCSRWSSAAACSPRRASARGCSSAWGCATRRVTKVRGCRRRRSAGRSGSASATRWPTRGASPASRCCARRRSARPARSTSTTASSRSSTAPRSGRPILFTQVPGSAGRYVQKFVTETRGACGSAARPGLLLRGPHAVFFDAARRRGGRACRRRDWRRTRSCGSATGCCCASKPSSRRASSADRALGARPG